MDLCKVRDAPAGLDPPTICHRESPPHPTLAQMLQNFQPQGAPSLSCRPCY